MYNTSESVYALNYSSRSIVGAYNANKHRWVAGTCSLTQENELSVLEYDEDAGALDLNAIYRHPEQVWNLAACPVDPGLIVSSHVNKKGQHGVTLWRMPGQEAPEFDDDNDDATNPSTSNPDKQDLENICSLKDLHSQRPFASAVRWSLDGTRVLTTGGGRVLVQDLAESRVVDTIEVDVGLKDADISGSSYSNSNGSQLTGTGTGTAAWDPHSPNCCIAASGSALSFVDTRACAVSATTQACASTAKILDIDCNPNKPGAFITCGDDRLLRCWDTRSMEKGPVRTLFGHSHWAVTCRYNPFHDQLMLSGGTDNGVNLWRIASCSSAPWLGGEADADDSTTGGGGGKSDTASGRARSSSRSSSRSAGTCISAAIGEEEEDSEEDSMSLDPPDSRIRCYDQHTDSIYALAWSQADAWSFCSVSYDGRVAVNHVPSSEKYKILL